MDTLSHGLWGVAVGQAIGLKLGRRLDGWKFFLWGVLPDLASFGVPFVWTIYQVVVGGIAWGDFGPPRENGAAPDHFRYPIYNVASLMYGPTHSLIVFVAVILTVWLVKNGRRRLSAASFPWPMLGWGLHVIMDVPTHSYRFYPTPVLWPVSNWKFNGVSWGQPWFMALDAVLLAATFFVLWLVRKKRVPTGSPPLPEPSRVSAWKKTFSVKVLVAVAIIAAAASVFFFWRVFQLRQAVVTPAVVYPTAEGGISTEAPAVGGIAVEEQPPIEVPPPEPPPPVVIRPKNSLGLQRIDFNPPIGDIGRIYFDRVNRILLMAVTEADGLRSIWRLNEQDLTITRVLEENDRPGEVFLGGDGNGRVYVGFADPGTLYRSEDMGINWRKVMDGMDGTFWAIADDARGTLWGAQHAWNSAILYRSTDDGLTWQPWKDFQKLYPDAAKPYREGDDRFALRHLHSVAWFDGKLLVGTGDVARMTLMSADGGETWRQVWSEGYTAWAPLDNRSGLLLGPDRLQSHGIARLDLSNGRSVEVWSPIPYGYAGYTYSLMAMEGVYYAAFHTETNEVEAFAGRSGVILSPDGDSWYPFLEFDPLSNWARTDIFLAPGGPWSGHITLNGALYLFEPPLGRWFEVHRPFNR